MRLIIADTSCLIIFTKLARTDILQRTFSELVTTDRVVAEYGTLPDWVGQTAEYDQNRYRELNQDLGPGESSCIALALDQKGRQPLLIIDDRQAKNVAESLGLECIGSLGVLLIAKRQGVIAEVSSVLAKIQTTDFRVSAQVLKTVRRLAGET